MTAPAALPWRVRARILFRLFAVQGSWNYDVLVGTGIGFCIDPAAGATPVPLAQLLAGCDLT